MKSTLPLEQKIAIKAITQFTRTIEGTSERERLIAVAYLVDRYFGLNLYGRIPPPPPTDTREVVQP
jgi:hypothetical protein